MKHPAGSVWQRPERAARGPAPEYSRARIAAAAVAVADAEGLAAVSMRRVAAEIGAAPASLYRYVTSRDDLIDLMADATSAEFDLSRPATGEWLDDLIRLGHQIRGIHERHRWLADLTPDKVIPGPRTLDVLEYSLSLLADLDAPAQAKMEAIVMLGAVITIFVRNQPAGTDSTQADAQRRAAGAGYLATVLAKGEHRHLAVAVTAMAAAGAASAGQDEAQKRSAAEDRLLRRVLSGLLGQ
ncbi:TetR/AcrR family transcriptional regulator [Planosporangium mesophilum]|uniref:TetR family transcriptional regulator n=1 Tax=Planosporangium mesophilum TaxID=689768 RepID=A0A8J3TC60_9ACTN|nr:TetR/AcrR family transcriptional regulator [Planosporangium mesophilum]NJC85117.1 TetR/AcrR family transcriptional regulator [Planosporangium mesophilum]GII24430.1 TetR family transcriptional regulator [Planosporangium mesophilum]